MFLTSLPFRAAPPSAQAHPGPHHSTDHPKLSLLTRLPASTRSSFLWEQGLVLAPSMEDVCVHQALCQVLNLSGPLPAVCNMDEKELRIGDPSRPTWWTRVVGKIWGPRG